MDQPNNIPDKEKKAFNSIIADLIYATLMQGNCIGYEQIPFDDTEGKKLTVPRNAQLALIAIESESTNDIVARYIESETENASSSLGMPLGHLGITEIRGRENLLNFTIIGTDSSISKCNVQYYG